jgi:RHS repeat-associated protein
MQQPGRTYTNGSQYRYGFNGKEKDKDMDGNSYDYGFRIYNPQIGKFLSVDPLTNKYPELTPYQYASNRPIDGIDMDGLEYLTYTIVINKTTSKITSQSYNWYCETQHNIHGNLGRGVFYDIRFYDEKSKSWSFNSVFVARDAHSLGIIPTEYGNYMGATSLSKMQENGSFNKEPDYDLPAVDHVDNLAKQHDIGYDKLDAKGANSLFGDWGTTPVDEAALKGWYAFEGNYRVGDKDPFNGQAVTSEERRASINASTLFSIVIDNKKKDIAHFMYVNYSDASRPYLTDIMGFGEQFSDKAVKKNYNLFLNKYMKKDEAGNWTRLDGMWSKDKAGNWTPNKPKS